jgi:hypothetical protein
LHFPLRKDWLGNCVRILLLLLWRSNTFIILSILVTCKELVY